MALPVLLLGGPVLPDYFYYSCKSGRGVHTDTCYERLPDALGKFYSGNPPQHNSETLFNINKYYQQVKASDLYQDIQNS